MKTITKLTLISLFFLSINTIDANILNENYKLKSDKKNDKSFTNIEIDGAFTVIINQAEEENISIDAADNMKPYIKSSIKNNTLKIKLKTGFGEKELTEIKLFITIKDLKKLKLSGFINLKVSKQINLASLIVDCSGAVKGELNSNTKSLNLQTSSFSNLVLKGATDNLAIKKNDASSIDASKLNAKSVKINSSGFGKVNILVANELSIKSSGAVEISYNGNPKISKLDLKGFSKLKKLK